MVSIQAKHTEKRLRARVRSWKNVRYIGGLLAFAGAVLWFHPVHGATAPWTLGGGLVFAAIGEWMGTRAKLALERHHDAYD